MPYCRALEVVGGWVPSVSLRADQGTESLGAVGLPRRLPTIPISAERCWCFHYSLAIADLDPANSANVVDTAQDSLGTIIRTKCLYPFAIPWRTGRREVVSLARAFGMTIRHCSGLPEGDRGPLFPDWCIEPPDGARLESGLGSCLQFGQRWPAEHLRPVLRPPTYPPKWGRMGRNQRSSETLVY